MDKRALAKGLMECGCVRVGRHKLSSGGFSPYYIDLRRVPSFPEVFGMVVEAYLELLKGLTFERVAGVPTAGIPLGVLVAHKRGKPFLYLRRESKDHGTGRLLEGELKGGEKVLLVDDVTTTGESLKWAAGVLRGEGGRVEEAAVLVDREEGAEKMLREEGIRLLHVMTARELLQDLYSTGSIKEQSYMEIVKYMEERKHV